mmetsp:Transcript_15110/g.57400  ORF Transcript_15110/g.57400 Transcript_15110/m.57400 type:complete len:329 (-) Transcript_15110:1587-2573(-)
MHAGHQGTDVRNGLGLHVGCPVQANDTDRQRGLILVHEKVRQRHEKLVAEGESSDEVRAGIRSSRILRRRDLDDEHLVLVRHPLSQHRRENALALDPLALLSDHELEGSHPLHALDDVCNALRGVSCRVLPEEQGAAQRPHDVLGGLNIDQGVSATASFRCTGHDGICRAQQRVGEIPSEAGFFVHLGSGVNLPDESQRARLRPRDISTRSLARNKVGEGACCVGQDVLRIEDGLRVVAGGKRRLREGRQVVDRPDILVDARNPDGIAQRYQKVIGGADELICRSRLHGDHLGDLRLGTKSVSHGQNDSNAEVLSLRSGRKIHILKGC